MAARRRRYNTMARAIVSPGAQLRERALDAGDHQGARPHRASERLSIVLSPWPSAVELGLEEQAGGREPPAPARRCVLEETDVALTSTGTSTETLLTCHRGRAITNPPSVAPCRWPGVPSAPPWAPRRSPPGVVLCRCQPPELPPRCPRHARGLTPQRALALSSGLRSRETAPSSSPPPRRSSSSREEAAVRPALSLQRLSRRPHEDVLHAQRPPGRLSSARHLSRPLSPDRRSGRQLPSPRTTSAWRRFGRPSSSRAASGTRPSALSSGFPSSRLRRDARSAASSRPTGCPRSLLSQASPRSPANRSSCAVGCGARARAR